jgi:hypothetical protein
MTVKEGKRISSEDILAQVEVFELKAKKYIKEYQELKLKTDKMLSDRTEFYESMVEKQNGLTYLEKILKISCLI